MTLEEYFINKMEKLEAAISNKRIEVAELSSLVSRYEHVLDIIKDRAEVTLEFSDKAQKFFIRFMPEYIWEGSPQYEALKEVFYLKEENPYEQEQEEKSE